MIMHTEGIWMIDNILDEKQKKFKELILKMEQESLANITKVDDKVMVSKIIRLYEEENKK